MASLFYNNNFYLDREGEAQSSDTLIIKLYGCRFDYSNDCANNGTYTLTSSNLLELSK